MEAFSLLKYWRGGGGGTVAGDSNVTLKTITESTGSCVSGVSGVGVTDQSSESEGEGNADDGPFFDMEFTVRDEDGEGKSGEIEDIVCVREENEREKDSDEDSDECDCENERELKFTLSSASSGNSIDPNISLSPSDDLFFKGRLVPLSEPNCKPVSPLKSATKLRVLMLKLKKSTKLSAVKTVESEKNVAENPKKCTEKDEIKQQSKHSAKFFTVNFKADEVPMLSLFTRENSSKITNTKSQKQNVEKSPTVQDEKVFSKDVMNKYLKKVKPLYVRVSKRYGEKLGFSGHLSLSGERNLTAPSPPAFHKSPPAFHKSPPAAAKSSSESPKLSESTPRRNVKNTKPGSFPAKLRVVRKRLGKSKSASSTVTSATDSPPVTSKRRDDSLLQQQDGIQSAIMHCKRSFKASREMEEPGVLRSVNGHPKNAKSVNVSTADLSCSGDKPEAAN